MDFHSLARRDLQTLCKKNKIPANITNVAMADSLSSLQHVEGLEDFLNGTLTSEVTGIIGSPNAPKTACRTATRRKPTVVEEPDSSMQTLTRTRRTARRGVADEAVAEPETPAVQSSRQRKAVPVSVSKKTEVCPVQSAYSTRRSVRFLEKTLENLKLEEGSKSQPIEIDAVPEESMAELSAKLNGSSEKEVSSDITLEVEAEKPKSESVDSVETSEEKMDVEDETVIEKEMTSHELQTELSRNFEAHREIETEVGLAGEIPEEVSVQKEVEESTENVTVNPLTELEQENVAMISEIEESSKIEASSDSSEIEESSELEASDFEAESEKAAESECSDGEEEEESDDETESDESDSDASQTDANEDKSEQQISGQFPRPTLPTPNRKNRPETPMILDESKEENKLTKDENCADVTNNGEPKRVFEKVSLRQLQKMLRNKLQTKNAKKEENTRVALQTLPENL